jgi:hypothetical protein
MLGWRYQAKGAGRQASAATPGVSRAQGELVAFRIGTFTVTTFHRKVIIQEEFRIVGAYCNFLSYYLWTFVLQRHSFRIDSDLQPQLRDTP